MTHPDLEVAAGSLGAVPSPEPTSWPAVAGDRAGDPGGLGVARAPEIGAEIRLVKLNRLTAEGTVQGKASRSATNNQSP